MKTMNSSPVMMMFMLAIAIGGCSKKPEVAHQKAVAAKTTPVATAQHTLAAKTKPITDLQENHTLTTRAPSYYTAAPRAQTRTVAAGAAATQEIILSAPPNTTQDTPLSTTQIAQIQQQLHQQRLNIAKGESNLERVETPRPSPRLSARSIIVQPKVNDKN